MVISGGGTMFIGCWGCWSWMCSEGLVWTTMPPEDVVIMEVLRAADDHNGLAGVVFALVEDR